MDSEDTKQTSSSLPSISSISSNQTSGLSNHSNSSDISNSTHYYLSNSKLDNKSKSSRFPSSQKVVKRRRRSKHCLDQAEASSKHSTHFPPTFQYPHQQTSNVIHTHYIYPQLRSRANPALDLSSVRLRNKAPDPQLADYSVTHSIPASTSPSDISHSRLFGLEEVPVFHPSLTEFQHPLEYLAKIAPIGKKFGAVKIVPPSQWDPIFSLDTEVSFSFLFCYFSISQS